MAWPLFSPCKVYEEVRRKAHKARLLWVDFCKFFNDGRDIWVYGLKMCLIYHLSVHILGNIIPARVTAWTERHDIAVALKPYIWGFGSPHANFVFWREVFTEISIVVPSAAILALAVYFNRGILRGAFSLFEQRQGDRRQLDEEVREIFRENLEDFVEFLIDEGYPGVFETDQEYRTGSESDSDSGEESSDWD